MHKIYLICLTLLLSVMRLCAQDTLILTARQADSLFIQRSLLVLAGRYQIDASQAFIQQERLWDNPSLTSEWNLYNPSRRRALDVGTGGQKAFAIQQTVVLAGKRSKRVALATENARMTESEFGELLRTLKFELRTQFYTVFFLQNTLAIFYQQQNRLTDIISAFERQYGKNNVSLRELVRLKALRFQLDNDRLELELQLTEAQKNLRNLLQSNAVIKPVVAANLLIAPNSALPALDEATNAAIQHRPDLQSAESLVKQAQLNVALQKSLAVPDLRLGAAYDQNGSYVANYTAFTVALDLPLLNKNQGNIRAAQAQVDYNMVLQRNRRLQIENEVRAAFQKIQQVETAYKQVDRTYLSQFEELNQGVFRSFEKQNLSLVEFVDLFQSYLDNIRHLNRLRADRINAHEELNYVVGTELVKY